MTFQGCSGRLSFHIVQYKSIEAEAINSMHRMLLMASASMLLYCFHLADSSDTVLGQHVGGEIGGNVLLSGNSKDVFDGSIDARNFFHCPLPIEAAGVEAVQAGDNSARADNVIGGVEDTALRNLLAIVDAGELVIGGAADDFAL